MMMGLGVVRGSLRWSLVNPCRALRGGRPASGSPAMTLIKELRARTNAPVLDCKKALSADGVDGDLSKAVDWLRSKGVASALKRSGRAASEGLVGVAVDDSMRGALVEVNCETDFVSRSDVFQTLVADMVRERLAHDDDEEGWQSRANELILNVATKVQENVQLRRAHVMPPSSLLSSYVHGTVSPGVGRTGVLVGIEAPKAAVSETKARARLEEVSSQIAMHIVAASPIAITAEDVPATVVEREQKVLMDQGLASGKPADVVEKMVSGRMKKFYKDVALMDQEFMVGEGKQSVAQLLAALSKEVGGDVSVTSFERYHVGETSDDA